MEDQITIIMGGHEPTRKTGEAGRSSASTRLARLMFAARLLEQASHELNRKA